MGLNPGELAAGSTHMASTTCSNDDAPPLRESMPAMFRAAAWRVRAMCGAALSPYDSPLARLLFGPTAVSTPHFATAGPPHDKDCEKEGDISPVKTSSLNSSVSLEWRVEVWVACPMAAFGATIVCWCIMLYFMKYSFVGCLQAG